MNPTAADPNRRGLPTPWVALAVTAVVIASLLLTSRGRLDVTLGDTDDAMRLVIVRALASGEAGWFHQHLARLQPPLGLDMHWSRLVDGGLAGMMRAFGLVLSPQQAEAAARMAWPLIWTFPAIWSVLAIARRMGGRAALIAAAGFLMINMLLFAQWRPGRIDHHNLQITFALVAVAAAVRGGALGGLLAGAATGLGLAVGLEALPFLGLAGASFALRFLFEPKGAAPDARGYAGALLVTLSLAYVLQTPPWRLSALACDALAVNLWAAVAVACLGLLAAVWATRSRGPAVRLTALGLAAIATGAVYAGLDPTCLHGPLGGVDRRIGPIWMDHVSEMQPLLARFWIRRPSFAVCTLVLLVLGTASWLWLGARRAGRTAAWLLLGACLAAATATALDADRMAHYLNWFAAPLIALALGDLTNRYWKGGLAPAIVLIAATGQPALLALLDAAPGWVKPVDKAEAAAERCLEGRAYARLASLPPGLVLGEIDLGPRILAQTPDSVVAAPYHRMGWGILAAHQALSAPPGEDERAARALGATYVVTCPAGYGQRNHRGLGARSLQVRLDRGVAPAWLEPLSLKSDPLQVYRVRPLARPAAGA